MLNKKMIYVAGLPCSGGSLLCQLFDQHPDIYSTGQNSPLCQTLIDLRHNLSGHKFLLNQLDGNFDLVYKRLLHAHRGFINGWYNETDKPWVVDKSYDWVRHLETLHSLDPNFRMLICVRELSQILGDLENQHQKTLLLDFADRHLANLSRRDRANQFFAETGIIGEPLRSIQSIQDIDPLIQKHLYYVIFEHLITEPMQVMQGIWQWLELPPVELNLEPLQHPISASRSYDRFKYPDQNSSIFQVPAYHVIAPSLDQGLKQAYSWFYHTFYPGKL